MLSIVNEIITNIYSALTVTHEQRYVHDALQAIDNTDRFALLNGRTRSPGENNYGAIHDIHTFVVASEHHTTMIKEWKHDIEARRDETRNYLILGEGTLEVRDDETQIEIQKYSFMIVTSHLDGEHYAYTGTIDNQLLMCIPGCGGTGKSQLIRALT
ncbi:unnamed protein product, partial [Rotaria sordida]